MPIRLHLLLLTLANILALLGGFMLGMTLHESLASSLSGLLREKVVVFIVFGMLPAGLALYATRLLFGHLIPARCPECRGPAYYRPSRREKAMFGGHNKVPVTYHCRRCGDVHRTNVYPADIDHQH